MTERWPPLRKIVADSTAALVQRSTYLGSEFLRFVLRREREDAGEPVVRIEREDPPKE